jgi:hypothetical protein
MGFIENRSKNQNQTYQLVDDNLGAGKCQNTKDLIYQKIPKSIATKFRVLIQLPKLQISVASLLWVDNLT